MNNSQTNDSNPCYSGQWSRTCMLQEQQCASLPGLNPCCSGQWSCTDTKLLAGVLQGVLILIVVDDGLVRYQLVPNYIPKPVLILIVVEDGLVQTIGSLS